MFTDPLVAKKDTATSADRSYSLIQNNGTGSVRICVSPVSVGIEPKYLKISHNSAGKGARIRDRHLVRFETPTMMADGTTLDDSLPLVIQCTLDVPRHGVVAGGTVGALRQLCGFLRGVSGSATPDWTLIADRILIGEF